MRLAPIINSLLETDQYKLSMGQAIFHQFNKDTTTWAFKCRNADVQFISEMVEEITQQIGFATTSSGLTRDTLTICAFGNPGDRRLP